MKNFEFSKGIDENTVCIEYNGNRYVMTKDEIEAAYRYQQHQYLLQDAERQLDIFVFGYELDDHENLTESEYEEAEYFSYTYGLTYIEAKKYLEAFVFRFESSFDCNIDENTAWNDAIEYILNDIRT